MELTRIFQQLLTVSLHHEVTENGILGQVILDTYFVTLSGGFT